MSDDSLQGTSGSDTLSGGDGDDTIQGAGGADSLSGGDDDDSISGGGGNDTIDGGSGEDELFGNGGDDVISGGTKNDTIYGGAGGDTIDGGDQHDRLYGEGGDDSIDGGSSNDTIYGGDGNDTIEGGSSNNSDTLYGGDGDDLITDGGGNKSDDALYGEAGNDTLAGGMHRDTLDGGDDADVFIIEDDFSSDTIIGGEGGTDFDTIDFSALTTSVIVNYSNSEDGTATDSSDTLQFSEVEGLILTSYGDTVNATSDSAGQDISAGDGADSVAAGSGDDVIDGGSGADTISGGAGADTIDGGAGADSLVGGDGNDSFYGSDGADTIDGGSAWWDTVSYENSASAVTVDLSDASAESGGDAQGDVLSNIEQVYGSHHSDSLVSGSAGERLAGLAGDDTLVGTGSVDNYFWGGDGDDVLYGGAGADELYGEAGSDTFVVEDGFGDDTIGGGESSGDDDTIDLSAVTVSVTVTYSGAEGGTITDGSDTISFSETESLILGQSGDVLDASSIGTGVSVDGGAGADSLVGGSGADTLTGGADADTLQGGAGDDQLTLGSGSDVVVLSRGGGSDTVTDFTIGADQIDVSALQNTDGSPITAWDVTVSDDGSGNTLLTFPEGEALRLQGIDSSLMTSSQLVAAGIPCFTPGTLIQTPLGPRPVEALRPGDLVSTLDHGPQPLIWRAERFLSPETLQDVPRLRPVRVHAGAFGNRRDLLVSPQHCVMLHRRDDPSDQRLVRARHLTQTDLAEIDPAPAGVTYVHIMCARHQIIFAEGAPTETFYPGHMVLGMLTDADKRSLFEAVPALRHGSIRDAIGRRARRVMRRRHAVAEIGGLGETHAAQALSL